MLTSGITGHQPLAASFVLAFPAVPEFLLRGLVELSDKQLDKNAFFGKYNLLLKRVTSKIQIVRDAVSHAWQLPMRRKAR